MCDLSCIPWSGSVANRRHVDTHITGVLGKVGEKGEHSVSKRVYRVGGRACDVQCSVYQQQRGALSRRLEEQEERITNTYTES